MKYLYLLSLQLILLSVMLTAGCKRDRQTADIPDIESIYRNILYLDTLLQSDQIDSIGKVNDDLTARMQAYGNNAQSAEDVAILDSLHRITNVVSDFLQFCTSTQTNLELLEQDTKSLESRFRSGKIKIAAYIADLLEAEQILVDLQDQLASKNTLALQYLRVQSQLVNQLNPLPDPGY